MTQRSLIGGSQRQLGHRDCQGEVIAIQLMGKVRVFRGKRSEVIEVRDGQGQSCDLLCRS